MLVTWNHPRKVLEVRCELLNLNDVVRLDIIPAPDEFVEGLLVALLHRQHLWMLFGVVHLSQFLQCNLFPHYFFHSFVSANYRVIPIFIHFASQLIQKLAIGDPAIAAIRIDQKVGLFFIKKDFSTL
jgi:hypothetical protein